MSLAALNVVLLSLVFRGQRQEGESRFGLHLSRFVLEANARMIHSGHDEGRPRYTR